MNALVQFPIIATLFILARSADLSISAMISRDTIRAIVYGIVALLALIFVLITLLHI